MKKYIFAFAAAAFALTACNDWLDVEPTTEMDRNALFSSEAGFADAAAGVYSTMVDESLYGKNLTWYMLELMGGGATYFYGNPGNYAGYSFHPKASYYMESLRNSDLDPIWNNMYNAIANINSILEKIDDSKDAFEYDDYNVFKGELLGLRAFLHFDLVRLFGGAKASTHWGETCIPYVTELTSQVYGLLPPEQICTLCLEDLKQAAELMKTSDPIVTGETKNNYLCSAPSGKSMTTYNIGAYHNRRFHFNYYAALATMARVYQWMGDKSNALACAQQVIAAQSDRFQWVKSDLLSNIQSSSAYVCRDRTFSTEQIFAVNVQNLDDRTDGTLWAGQYGLMDASHYGIGVNTECFPASTQAYDFRYKYLLGQYNYYGSILPLTLKYIQDGSNYSPWAEKRIPLIRISEMYLIAADCSTDNVETGLSYVNAIRCQRGLSADLATASSSDELKETIFDEYRREFVFEGQLFYLNKRLNRTIHTSGMYSSDEIDPELFVMPRPDDEDTYGGRN